MIRFASDRGSGLRRGAADRTTGRRVLCPLARIAGVAGAAILALTPADVLQGAGMSTHFECADLARTLVDGEQYADLVEALHRVPASVIQDGAIFPDWGYALELNRDAAELAHGSAFYNAGLEYMYATYGAEENWGEHEQRLFAFLFGIACHVELDDAWHFGSTAFLQVAMQEDNATDLQVEVFADLFTQVEHRRGLEQYDRWVPVEDMIRIYENLGQTDVRAADVITGSVLQYVALFLEDTLAWVAYYPGRARFPFTRNNYYNWWDGGVRNGAERTAGEWQEMWDTWVALSGGGDAEIGTRDDAGDRDAGAASVGGDHESDVASVKDSHRMHRLVDMAATLLQTGVIEVPMRDRGHGSVSLSPPQVQDWEILRRELHLMLQGESGLGT